MKRCPQCLFLYPDADEKCDFDKTPLEVVDDTALDAATNQGKKRRMLPVVAAVVLMAGLLAFAIYYGLSHRRTSAASQNSTIVAPATSPEPVLTTLPSPSPIVSPSPSPSPSPKPSIAPTSASRTTTNPISTSGPEITSRPGGKAVIVLTSGARIEADEVWRTRDGVWYRRSGMVTLLKRNQIKAVITK